MAASLKVCQKQRVVIAFIVVEGNSQNIHQRLNNVYKDRTFDYSDVWT